jgi:hypothetical protein
MTLASFMMVPALLLPEGSQGLPASQPGVWIHLFLPMDLALICEP